MNVKTLKQYKEIYKDKFEECTITFAYDLAYHGSTHEGEDKYDCSSGYAGYEFSRDNDLECAIKQFKEWNICNTCGAIGKCDYITFTKNLIGITKEDFKNAGYTIKEWEKQEKIYKTKKQNTLEYINYSFYDCDLIDDYEVILEDMENLIDIYGADND